MKKKLLLIALLTFVTVCLFAITASAEAFSVTYHNLWSEQQETVLTDDNGQIIVKDTGYATETNKELICWYTMDGDIFQLGENITITEDISLYEGYGYKVTLENMGYVSGSNQWDQSFIQLQEDIVLDYNMGPPWGGRVIIDLNGHTITTSAEKAFDQSRAGVVIVGKGKIIHTGAGAFFQASSHGYGDGQQRLIIGKNVIVETNGALVNYTNNTNTNVPIQIFGEVKCSKICHMSDLRNKLDITINPKKLIVTGDTFVTVGKFQGGTVSINITGGQLELLPNASTLNYWNNGNFEENKSFFDIYISGGTFNVGLDNLQDYIYEETKVLTTEINGVTYSKVATKNCNHNYEITGETNASCIQLVSKTYTCKECFDTYTLYFDKYLEHVWNLTSDTPPTLSSNGIKVYTCNVCNQTKNEFYYVDVANEEIKVTIKTEEGEKEILVKVSDIFVLEKAENNGYTLTDLKDFGTYFAKDVVSINIPLGIEKINFANENKTLQKLVITDNAVVTIVNFSKYSALTHIEIGASNVTFARECGNSVIQSIKSETQGANVTFKRKAFYNKGSLSELKLSAYSKYVFYGYSFQNAGVKEFIAPDFSDVVLLKGGAFNGCKSLEYVYFGKGIKRMDGDVFNNCSKLKTAILVDINEIVSEGAFAHIAGGTKPLEVYIHQDSVYMARYIFQDSEGVIVYTNTPMTSKYAFDRCEAKEYDGVMYPKYTIYLGIGHKYVEVNKESTCTEIGVEGYMTDCPCGEILNGVVSASVYYGVLTDIPAEETVTYSGKIIPMKEHTEGSVTHIEYINGYLANGLKDCICKVCNNPYTEEYATATPIFEFLGYSMPEDGRLEISIGYIINYESMSVYNEYTGKTFEYGVVFGLANQLGDKAPLDEGAVAKRIDLDNTFTGFSLKISGFKEEHKDLGIVMAMYLKVIDGEESKIVYLQDSQKDKPTSVSINSLSK